MSKTLDRISKVLNQAENASTPEEAAAYMERAQQLATVASIDLAVARMHNADKEKREEVEKSRRIQVNPWGRRTNRKFFMDLFLAISAPNDVHCLMGGTGYYIWATGFPSDIDVTEALFGQAAVQMVSEADACLQRGDNKFFERKDVWNDSKGDFEKRNVPVSSIDGRVWRTNFYEGYIARTKSRLWEAKRKTQKQAEKADRGEGTAVALRNKTKEVGDAFDEQVSVLNPRGRGYTGGSSSEPDYSAFQRGSDAAARARLDSDANDLAAAAKKRELG